MVDVRDERDIAEGGGSHEKTMVYRPQTFRVAAGPKPLIGREFHAADPAPIVGSSKELSLKKLAVLVVHGVGSQSDDYADATIEELTALLAKQGHAADSIAWESVYWADILEPRELAFLARAGETNDLDWPTLRSLVVQALGDAAAYKFVDSPSSTYVAIHNRIRAAMNRLYSQGLNREAAPLVVMAHSLGSQIMSCYIWDTQSGMLTGADAASTHFERMEWLAGMVTFGSPIPLFTFADADPKPIRFPGDAIPGIVRAKAKWLNYYDKDDVLGYPIRPVSDGYRDVVDADIEVNVGGLISAATPKSHIKYWTDNDFTKPVAQFLGSFLD